MRHDDFFFLITRYLICQSVLRHKAFYLIDQWRPLMNGCYDFLFMVPIQLQLEDHLSDHLELDKAVMRVLKLERGQIIDTVKDECGIPEEMAEGLVEAVIDDPSLNHRLHNVAMDMACNSYIGLGGIKEMEKAMDELKASRSSMDLLVDKLLEKVLLETDLLDLKANPKKKGVGAVIESSLDKGRGYLATVLVQNGTLKTGDMVLSGCYYGRIKAMFNERGQKVKEAGPSTPVSILGLNGAPSAGDKFNVMTDEKEAKAIANKREQLIRIQGIKTQKHMTLEEIGRRIAIGNFKELNVIVKGDVDGSVEALSDSLIKLSTEQVRVNVIHKAVGAISESDVILAEASDAVIIGFQVRPSTDARKVADDQGIEIRLYSVIYDAINDVKDGIEGLLEPIKKEEVTGTAEVKQTFKISKVGTIAGCLVKEGKIAKTSQCRLIRDGIVVYTGDIASLKRNKDDAKDVSAGMECGIGIEKFNDIKVGDMIEAFIITEIKQTLD